MTVALGFGSCLDWEIVWDGNVIRRLVESGPPGKERTLQRGHSLSSDSEIASAIVHHFELGTGAEYPVASPDIVRHFAANFEYVESVGGTAIRAAIAMSVFDVSADVQFGQWWPGIDEHLPATVRPHFVSGAEWESLGTVSPHVIVQFEAGEEIRIGDRRIIAPSSNRLILVCDRAATQLAHTATFLALAPRSRILLASGFNSITDPRLLAEALDRVRTFTSQMPPQSIVWFEDAGCHDERLRALIRTEMASIATIHSMNEDEMAAHIGRPVDVTDPIDTAAAIKLLRTLVESQILVIHTSRWVAATGQGTGDMVSAFQQGQHIAAARARFGDNVDLGAFLEVQTVEPQPRSITFAHELSDHLGMPGFVLPTPEVGVAATTVGLGDTFVGGAIAKLAKGL